MKSSVTGIAVLALLLPSAAQAPLPVEKEPHHRVVLENAYVRVLDIILAPGEATLNHSHTHDALQVMVVPSKFRDEVSGKPPRDTLEDKPGEVGFVAFSKTPLTHRIRNIGAYTLHMIEVEFLAPSAAPPQTPFQQETSSYKMALDNERVRVFRRDLPPGGSSGMHTHQRPMLSINVTGGSFFYEQSGQPPRNAEVKPATVSWPPVPFSHALKNVGNRNAISLDVELK